MRGRTAGDRLQGKPMRLSDNLKVIVLAVAIGWGISALAEASNPDTNGRFSISASNDFVWRLDVVSGDISWCKRAGFERPPICSPMGTQSLAQANAFSRGSNAKIRFERSKPSAPTETVSDDDFLRAMEQLEKKDDATPN